MSQRLLIFDDAIRGVDFRKICKIQCLIKRIFRSFASGFNNIFVTFVTPPESFRDRESFPFVGNLKKDPGQARMTETQKDSGDPRRAGTG